MYLNRYAHVSTIMQDEISESTHEHVNDQSEWETKVRRMKEAKQNIDVNE